MRAAVFLDRDGVLNNVIVKNGRPHPPRSVADLDVLPGVDDSCNRLRNLGYLLVVVTNQPDIARGTADPSTVSEINEMLQRRLGLDSIWVCPHDDDDFCSCRKPMPGMIIEAAEHHGVDLTRSFMVGDRWRDIAAGRAAGCRTAWVVGPEYTERLPVDADIQVRDLSEAADWIEHGRNACVGGEHDDSF